MKNLTIGLLMGVGLTVGLWACTTDSKDETTDSDGDGIPDSVEMGADSENSPDTDNDGTPDYLDTDSDGDGIPDHIEAGDDPTKPRDTDKDGKPDYMETDSDNDGTPDKTEAGDDPTKPRDSDGDGTPDYMDSDSDNDGNPDITDNNNIDENEIQNGCENVFKFCPEGIEIRQALTDAEQCMTLYSCVVEFFSDDARCLGLLSDGWTCLEAMTSADACTTCNEILAVDIKDAGCGEPTPCFQAEGDGGV